MPRSDMLAHGGKEVSWQELAYVGIECLFGSAFNDGSME